MQLYVGDYLSDTLDLTTEQHGAYLLLLMTMWKAGGKLPSDPKKLARICRVSARRWHIVWPEISHFFDDDGSIVTNERLQNEYQKAVSIREKRAAAGAAGGAAKALKTNNQGLANAKAGPKHSHKSQSEPYNIDTNVSIGEPPPKKPVKRACAIPENWVPNQKNIDHALSKNFTEQEIENEAANFRNHHLARGTKFKDWDAGWRTWISNAIKFGNAGRGGGSRQSGRGAGTLDAFAQVAVNRYGNES